MESYPRDGWHATDCAFDSFGLDAVTFVFTGAGAKQAAVNWGRIIRDGRSRTAIYIIHVSINPGRVFDYRISAHRQLLWANRAKISKNSIGHASYAAQCDHDEFFTQLRTGYFEIVNDCASLIRSLGFDSYLTSEPQPEGYEIGVPGIAVFDPKRVKLIRSFVLEPIRKKKMG